jgi:hypothetical protein
MGALIYGSPSMEIQFDDRVLAHVQIVMSAKLRRGENFFFSWRDSPAVGDGRSAVWIDPSIPMYFRYSGSRHPEIDREWLEQMAIAAASTHGLDLTEDQRLAGMHHARHSSVKRKDRPLDD